MRTRKSNQTRSYAQATGYGLDAESDTQQHDSGFPNIKADENEDELFQEPAANGGDDDDGLIAPDPRASASDFASPDEDADGDVDPDDTPRRSHNPVRSSRRGPKSARANARAQMRSHQKVDNSLVPYPQDGRMTLTRVYYGTFQKSLRAFFCEDFYGPDYVAVNAALGMFDRWTPYEVLPSKLLDERCCPMPTPWVPEDFEESQVTRARDWLARLQYPGSDTGTEGDAKQVVNNVSKVTAAPYLVLPGRDLLSLLGPVEKQQRHVFKLNESISIAGDGLPLEGDDDTEGERKPAGWMVDVGGLVLSLGWAPSLNAEFQILALAVSPHADQDFDAMEVDGPSEDENSRGSIQLWGFRGQRDDQGPVSPSREPGRLLRTLCFDWGRAKKLQWCPVPSATRGHLGSLAVLCNDGLVHVLNIPDLDPKETKLYEKAESSLAALGFPNEPKTDVTCFGWSGVNRLVTGHTDGSLALWSVYPQVCLNRIATHSTHVLQLATGYPSQPHLVASTPVSGLSAMVDMRDPAAEATTTPNPAISHTINTLDWCDHLQGFISMAPWSKPLNTTVGFYSSRAFSATTRKVVEGESMLSSLAVGKHHPFVLCALLDGSVWTLNPMNRVFVTRHIKAPPGCKMKLFQQEHVPRTRFMSAEDDEGSGEGGGGGEDGDTIAPHPAPPPDDHDARRSRGISRIAQGFKPIHNVGTKAPEGTIPGKPPRKKIKGNGAKAKGKKKKGDGRGDSVMDVDDEQDDDEEEGGERVYADPTKIILYEPLSRTVSMEWNPNLENATWAAFGMASGLVRVMDIGVNY